MGHISMSGPAGSIAAFATLGVERRIYVHMNNSNPVLRENSPARKPSRARAGKSGTTAWRSAYDEAVSLERTSCRAQAQEPMPVADFEAAIRAVGAERYHDKHPFHRLLHGGKLDKGQVQAWALNRYCYQSAVPRKDAALMSRAATTASCAANGCIACSTTTATAARKAASSAGWS